MLFQALLENLVVLGNESYQNLPLTGQFYSEEYRNGRTSLSSPQRPIRVNSGLAFRCGLKKTNVRVLLSGPL